MGRCVVSSEGAQDLRQLVSAELGRSAAARRERRKSDLGHVSPPCHMYLAGQFHRDRSLARCRENLASVIPPVGYPAGDAIPTGILAA